ncbi:transferase [Lentzea guizhouensis]|uniref:Transferase n=1 Tax=Lentzea guizhouensis TaxID=1586287 RepID=A0A1B2HQZ5_9PSEU|nr:transferase [Lentzea guizhouensis]
MTYSVVIPTIGRAGLSPLLEVLDNDQGPAPCEVIVVDDSETRLGPAAARNAGWRAARGDWVAFLDDDVVLPPDWKAQLARDLEGLADDVAATQARIIVPLPSNRRPTDAERGTAGLADALWITADMAYRRSVLQRTGGFDERFPRAYREDAELAVRVQDLGHRIVRGDRITTHPVKPATFFTSVQQQRGNADDALMRRLLGPGWRARIGGRPGRLREHLVTTAAGLGAVLCGLVGLRRAGVALGLVWAGLTGRFAVQRILPGPRDPAEVAQMVVTSAAIPPVACWHRLQGELRWRRGAAHVRWDELRSRRDGPSVRRSEPGSRRAGR